MVCCTLGWPSSRLMGGADQRSEDNGFSRTQGMSCLIQARAMRAVAAMIRSGLRCAPWSGARMGKTTIAALGVQPKRSRMEKQYRLRALCR
eukprot:297376-Heterocapsa_arctica.AAC.1